MCHHISEKFKPYHDEFILSLQYCLLKRKSHESTQEGMGRLCIMTADSKYKEYDRRLKKQFINDLDDENRKAEILKELTALKDTTEVSSDQI